MSFLTKLFGNTAPAGATSTRVDGSGARALVEAGAQLVDVRSPAELRSGHISGAINLPVDRLGTMLSDLDPTGTVVVYCRSGGRSASAARLLLQHGFADVKDLGPMSAW